VKRRPTRHKPAKLPLTPRVLPHVEIALRDHRRENAQKALAKIDAAEVLEQGDLYAISEILRSTLAGLDPRKDLGIAPKRGKPPSSAKLHVFLAADYLSLCETEPKEVTAAESVAARWGCDVSTVRKIATTNKAAAGRMKDQYTPDQILGIAELSVQHWQLRANQGN
jgi:hypothetical protein